MRITTIKFALFCLLIAGAISCKKDKDKSSKIDALTTGNWKWSKQEEKVNSGTYEDDVINWDACDKDDFIKFAKDKTYEYNEGATKCDPSDDQVIPGDWDFQDNETKLSIDGEVWNIDQLDNNALVLSASETFGSDTYYYRLTFVH